ncbi:MAG: AbrB/MazE/SpoVT family DNA-binding domain-containing protein [Acidobacteria bacterium]|nr:AbrB/MazE/SpoVT family DNA-binding domain-containing protein [Acidobacteriota bacterium]
MGKTAIREFQGNDQILEYQIILDYNLSMITTITGKNQVTVPAEIARKEGLRPGTRLEWRSTEREHVLEVRVLPDPASIAASLRGRGNANRRLSGSPTDRLVQERENED